MTKDFTVTEHMAFGSWVYLAELMDPTLGVYGIEGPGTGIDVTFPTPALALHAAAILAEHSHWYLDGRKLAKKAAFTIPTSRPGLVDYP